MNVRRTLLKSATELWELADDLERMEAWMGRLADAAEPVPVVVTERESQRALIWQSADPRAEGRIAIELAESGLGTSVRISAHHSHSRPEAASAALEGLLDELGSPERRPFAPV